ADILAADVAVLIDDDEVFEIEDFVERGTEFIGKRIYGAVVHGMAGYYLNKNDQYYDDVKSESWMTYWDRFGTKAQAFDEIIGCSPRIKRTPFAFGGAMVLHKDLFQCVPFDPCITRGEDIDYLINSRMYGFSFFLDNTLSIKHLPEPKKHPQWKRIREDIYRFVYEQAKLTSQYKTSNMHMVSPEDFDPYPGAFLRDNLEEMIFRSNTMLATEYLMEGDAEGAREALNNISIARKEAKPTFDPFSRYRTTQKSWEQLARITSNQRYYLRKVMEEHNLSKEPIIRDTEKERKLRGEEIIKNLKEAFKIELSDGDRRLLEPLFFVKTYFEDETVFRSGDYNDALYIVLKGEILLYDTAGTAPHAEELEIARLKKGDILGESCMSYNTFSLNGRAEQFSEMIGIKAEDIQSVVKINQALGIALYQQILAKVVEKMRSGNSEKAKQKAVEKHFITGDD
ncbi:MAG: cyclic nucleotide-binding domain-containing protein, partial [Clostridiales bacterium]|nr:cyclic nucleotide-binding domain-containing protein [Clostridiales bacterium]